MIKKYNEFVNEELDNFYNDLKDSKRNLKFFSKFKSNISNIDLDESFDLGKPKKRFKPKMISHKKLGNNEKGIF